MGYKVFNSLKFIHSSKDFKFNGLTRNPHPKMPLSFLFMSVWLELSSLSVGDGQG